VRCPQGAFAHYELSTRTASSKLEVRHEHDVRGQAFGVDGIGIADQAPSPYFEGMTSLNMRMIVRLQDFPNE